MSEISTKTAPIDLKNKIGTVTAKAGQRQNDACRGENEGNNTIKELDEYTKQVSIIF